MIDQFTKPFADFFKTSPYNQVPGQMQSFVQDGIAKTREVTLKSMAAAKDGAEKIGAASPVASKEAGEFTSKAFQQAIDNTEAAFIAAQAMAQAKTPMEAAQIQAQYIQAQFAKAGEQGKELFELSTKVAQKSAEGMTQLAAKSGAGFKV